MDRNGQRQTLISCGTIRRRLGIVTIWNVAALIVLLLSALATLGAAHLYLKHWAEKTGIRVPVGGRYSVQLPYGTTLVYYESGVSVPQRTPLLKIRDAYGTFIDVTPPPQDNSFRMTLGGWSGRAIGQISIDEEGTYAVQCAAADFLSQDDVPAGDSVVFLKQPDTLAEATAVYKTILITGATITVVLTMVLYGVHFAVAHRKAAQRRTAPTREFSAPSG